MNTRITLLLTTVFLLTFTFINGQNLEVDGGAKINDLVLDNAAANVLVVRADGSLGIRSVASLGGGGGSSAFFVGGGVPSNGSGNADNFMTMGSSSRSSTFDDVKTRIPMAGTLTKFEGSIKGATASGSYTFHVMKNGGTTALTCVVTGASTTACTDLSNCVSFNEGDYIAVRYTGSGADNREGRWFGVFTPGASCP